MDLGAKCRSLLMFVAAVALTGCGARVDCNSSDVKGDADKIIQSHLDPAVWYGEMKLAMSGEPRIENIKTVETAGDGKQAQCSATYSVVYNEKPRAVAFNYYLAYLEDKSETEVKVAVRDVQAGLMGLAMSEKPQKNGEQKIVDQQNGQVTVIRRWKKGREHGVQEFYNGKTGALLHQYTAEDGVKTGTEKAWSPDGSELLVDLVWKDGKATGFATINPSDDQFNTHRTAGMYRTAHFKDGLRDGVQKTYGHRNYRSGELVKVEHFKDGKLDGITQKFGEDGSVKFQVLYSQGELVLDDPTTAQTLAACLAGYEARYANSRMVNAEYERPEWTRKCKEGQLPGRV